MMYGSDQRWHLWSSIVRQLRRTFGRERPSARVAGEVSRWSPQRQLETREEAIRIACAQLKKGLNNVEAVLGPNYQLIDRTQLEQECRTLRA